MVPRLACRELVPFVTEPTKFSMGLSSSPVDTYSIESMKDILRINLWRSEDLEPISPIQYMRKRGIRRNSLTHKLCRKQRHVQRNHGPANWAIPVQAHGKKIL